MSDAELDRRALPARDRRHRLPSSARRSRSLNRKLRFDLAPYFRRTATYDRHGRTVAAALRRRARPDRLATRAGGRTSPPHLPDGCWLVARQVPRARQSHLLITAFLALVAPCGRRLPDRRGLAAGSSDCRPPSSSSAAISGAWVKVEGRDEVAALAAALQPLGAAYRGAGGRPSSVARHCSHELRTPLARIAVAAFAAGRWG